LRRAGSDGEVCGGEVGRREKGEGKKET